MTDEQQDIVERLRATAETALPSTTGFTRLSDRAAEVLSEAADEIERLRQELAAQPAEPAPEGSAAPTASGSGSHTRLRFAP
jgi:hypothetical protein